MKKWKFGIALLFVMYGCYLGVLSISFLTNTVSMSPIIIDLMANELDSTQRLRLELLILLNAMQTIAMFISSVMCIVIGLSERKWLYIMTTGAIGLVKYICTFLVLLPAISKMEMISILRNFRLSVIPLSIIAFAIYCKQRKSDDPPYLPLPLKRFGKTLIGKIPALATKLATAVNLKRFTWPGVKETEVDADHQDNADE